MPDVGVEHGGSPKPASVPSDYQSFRSRPDLLPPRVTVSVHSHDASAGDIFLAPYSGPGQYGPMILDEDGRTLWFKPLPPGTRAADFRPIEYEGKRLLSWWQDPLVSGGQSNAGIVLADSSYRVVKVIRAGNGYHPDLHEFQITPEGTALITVYSGLRCNLASIGGPSDGAVADTQVQELDPKTGLVMYEWHSLDHVPLTDSYVSARPGSLASPFDYFHINSVDKEADGDLLIDSRNTWAAYDVDPGSGKVLWQLGGKHGSFKLGAGTVTAYQHDARRQPNGNITFFDNGATPAVHPQSRAIEISLSGSHGSTRLVRRAEHTPSLVSGSQGNLQALANGDWMVGWGQEPYLTEFAPDGRVLFDAHLPSTYESYRVFRAAWSAQPGGRPRIAVAGARVYVSWNGATEVASWRVLAGPSEAAFTPVAMASKRGFETAIALPASVKSGLVEVQALSGGGAVLSTSASAPA
ncbi:MAG TPA: arylsulfotransferase family protein [Solirubrobacteraceae bacterium]